MAPGGAGSVNDASRPAATAAARLNSSLEKVFFEAFVLDFFAKTVSPEMYVSKQESSAGATGTVKTKEKSAYLSCRFANRNAHVPQSPKFRPREIR